MDQDDQYYHAMRGVTGKDIEAIPMDRGGFGAFTVDQCYITDCGKSCNPGDITMTKLNDESGRGCGGKNHNARSCTLLHHSDQRLIIRTCRLDASFNITLRLLPRGKCAGLIHLSLEGRASQLPWTMCCRGSEHGL